MDYKIYKNFIRILLFITVVINLSLLYIFNYTIESKNLVYLPILFSCILYILFLDAEYVFIFVSIIFICLAGYFLYETYIHYDIYVYDGFTIFSVDVSLKYSNEIRSRYIIDMIDKFNVDFVKQKGLRLPIMVSFSQLNSLLEIENKALLDQTLDAFFKNYCIAHATYKNIVYTVFSFYLFFWCGLCMYI